MQDTTSSGTSDTTITTATNAAIKWELVKATYLLQDVQGFFRLEPDQHTPTPETAKALVAQFEHVVALLDALNNVLGVCFDIVNQR